MPDDLNATTKLDEAVQQDVPVDDPAGSEQGELLNRQVILTLADLKRRLAWEAQQKVVLLDSLARLRVENQRLQDRIRELENERAER